MNWRMKIKLILTYIAILFFFGCGSKIPISRNYEIVTPEIFDPSKVSGFGNEYVLDGNIYSDNNFNEEYNQIVLSIYHNPHDWEYLKPKEIIGQPLEEWTRKCKVCNFQENFILRK